MKLVPLFIALGAAAAFGSASPDLRRLPLAFEANKGQFAPGVLFGVSDKAVQVRITGDAIRFYRTGGTNKPDLEMTWRTPAASVEGEALMPGSVNYLVGSDSRQWRTGIPTYRRIRLRDIAAGVDLVLYGSHDEVEYDLVLAPGADVKSILLNLKGARRLRRDDTGSLVAECEGLTVIQRRPHIYQELAGRKTPVSGDYALRDKHQVGFRLAAYNKSKPLVIDPTLTFSTIFGGSGADSPKAVTVDSAGYIYVAGDTASTDFPVVNAYQSALPGQANGNSRHIFVTKLDPTGSMVLFSTYLGGSSGETGRDVAVDATGSVYVAGATVSSDYPTTQGTLRPTSSGSGGDDIVLTKLSPSGSALLYSAVIGGVRDDEVRGIAVDASGNCFLAGTTNSFDFPVSSGARNDLWKLDTLASAAKAFVMKVNPSAKAFLYSAVIGGTGVDQAAGVALDESGNAYLAGTTSSVDFPVTSGAYQTASGISGSATKGFVAQLSSDGANLGFATYLGGSGTEQIDGVALDSAKNVYVTGLTTSPDFPGAGASYFKPSNGSSNAVFVSKLYAGGAILAYSALFGGANNTVAGIAVDSTGRAVVAGGSDTGLVVSSGPQVYPGSWASTKPGGVNAFAVELNAPGADVVFSTYLGGISSQAVAVAVDSAGSAIITGTGDNTFPVTPGGYASPTTGQAFLAKISDSSSCTFAVQVLSMTIHVSTQTGCKWIAVPAAPWLSVTSGRSGTGSGTVVLSAPQNTGPARSGQVSVAGIAIMVNQPNGCQVNLSASGQTYGSEAGADQFTAYTQTGCSLPTASTPASWIHIVSASGVSPYVYSVDANPSGQPRYGTISIGGQVFAITQYGTPCVFSVSPASITAIIGNSNTFSVTSNYSGCSWSASAGASGLSLGPALGRGSGTVVIDPASVSAGAAAQVIAATIAGQPVSINIPGRGMFFGVINKLSGKALDLTSTAPGAATQQMDYTLAPSQQWELVPTGDGYYFILNYLNGNVLDIAGSSAANGTPINQRISTGTDDQKWQLVSVGGPYYRIINKLTGKALGVGGASLARGAAMHEWNYLGSDDQKFQLLPSVQIAVSANTPGAAITLTGNGCSAGAYTAPATVFARQAASCALSLSPPVGYGFALWTDGLTTSSRTISTGAASLGLSAIFTRCSYSLSSTGASFKASPASGSFTVTTQPGCGWVTNAPSWLSVNTAGTSSGSGTVSFTAASNDDLPRTANLNIAGKKFTVRQAGRASPQVWRPGSQHWYLLANSVTPVDVWWGAPGDIPVSGDFDGDGKADSAIWRPADGMWWVIPSSSPSGSIGQQWGGSGDIPVPADYDGDGKTDFAVYRPSTCTWFVIPSSNPRGYMIQQWGGSGDIPVPADYDGDGKTDVAVFRPATGTWFVVSSANPATYLVQQWGGNGDIPVPGDYDGDGKADYAVYRPSNGVWYAIPSASPGNWMAQVWGTTGDVPVPGDYDGDGKTDLAVWRPRNGTWYVVPSGNPGGTFGVQWGIIGDIPIVPRR